MKVSLKWLETMVEVPSDLQAFCDRLDLTGTGVEGVDKVGANLDGIVVGHILEKEAHPDSDHLWVTKVEVGEDEPLQIVCGAQNFNAGDKVPVATVGTVMPEGFKIKKSKLRGVPSCGMNCSQRELGLGADHEGLWILPADAPVGTPISEYLKLSDTVLDLEITPNRPDCLSMKGMAREVGAMYHKPWKYEPPVAYAETSGADVADDISVEIADTELCSRYTARVIENVKIGPSPDWLVERITALGARPINNIVDVTNYIMFELGQPLHAFDLNAFSLGADGKRKVLIHAAAEGEKFTTLDGEERELTPDMAVIADGNTAATVALAGVMGGLESEVTDETTSVLLESATFSTSHTSRTSRNLSLVSEASLRYERGVDAAACEEASVIAASIMAAVSGGTVRTGCIDEYPVVAEPLALTLRPERLRAHIGAEISDADIEAILTDLGCVVKKDGAEAWNIEAPTFRPDLIREIDLYEEVLRIWGMDRVPATLPAGKQAGGRSEAQQREQVIGRTLRACGLNETMTYSFVPADDLEKLRMPEEGRGEAVKLLNPMSVEQAVMRRTIIGGLMRSVAYNQSRGVHNVHLYETGTVFGAAEGRKSPKERKLVAGVLVGSWGDDAWNDKPAPLDFFDGKGVIENLMRELAVPKLRFKAADVEEMPWLQPGRAAQILGKSGELGWIGEIHPLVCREFDVAGPVVAFELDLATLVKCASDQRPYVDVPVYPAVEMDLAIVVDEDVTAERLQQCMVSAGKGLLESVRLFDVYRDEKRLGANKKSLAYSLTYRAADRTLTSEEVDKAHERVVTKACKATGGEIRA